MQSRRATRRILRPKMREEIREKLRQKETEGKDGGESAPEAITTSRPKIKLPKQQEGVSAPRSPAANPVPAKGEPFEERYKRVTTYLERDLHARVQRLRASGRVASVTALYNAALREYIVRWYGEGGTVKLPLCTERIDSCESSERARSYLHKNGNSLA